MNSQSPPSRLQPNRSNAERSNSNHLRPNRAAPQNEAPQNEAVRNRYENSSPVARSRHLRRASMHRDSSVRARSHASIDDTVLRAPHDINNDIEYSMHDGQATLQTNSPENSRDNVLNFHAARDARLERLRAERAQAEREQEQQQRAQIEVRRAERAQREKRLEERRAQIAWREEKLQKKLAKCPACHWGLFVATILLALLSIPLVYSASTPLALDHHKNGDFFLTRQIVSVAIGLAMFFAASRLSAKQLRFGVWTLYVLVFVGLLATDFTPLGMSMGGTRRWLKLPLFPLQVSELAKIALIGVMADFWSRASRTSQSKTWPWLVASALALPLIALVFFQPHLSAALLLATIPFVIAAQADVPAKQLVSILVPLTLFAVVTIVGCKNHAVPLLKTYQQDRIANHFGFGNSEKGEGAKDGNYQVNQSMRALVHGGVFGVGPGESLFKQGHLPAPHTDFILAVIGEEWGLVGLLALILAYSAIIFFCLHVGHCARTSFEALLCSGVGTLLAIQVLGNALVVTDMIPVTGIPLPLISYGGSGLICTLTGIGLVLGVSRRIGQAQSEEKTVAAPQKSTTSNAKVPARATSTNARRASLTA